MRMNIVNMVIIRLIAYGRPNGFRFIDLVTHLCWMDVGRFLRGTYDRQK